MRTSSLQRRLLQTLIGFVSVGAASGAFTTGCADNDSSLFIEGVLAMEAPQCSVQANPSSTMLGIGVLDVVFSSEYIAPLLVGNQLTPRGRKQQLRVETARITLRGAEVHVEDALGNELTAFTVPGTGFVHPDSSEDPGYGVFFATLIPGQLGAQMAGGGLSAAGTSRTLVANVRVFGDTLGGEEIESSELGFPIRVCNGCTIVYPIEAIDPVTGRCVETGEGGGTAPCSAGQGPIDCRLCSATLDLCLNPPVAP